MTKILDAVPNLVPLYAKAAAGSARKRPSSTEIATPALGVRGVAVPADRDAQFRAVAGAPEAGEAFFGHVHALIMPVQMQLMAADDFPLPMMGLVHTANTYRQLAPVPLDEKVDLEVRVEGFRAHRAGTEVVLTATVTAAGTDRVLVEEETLYLAKGVRLEGAEGAAEVSAAKASGAPARKRPAFKVPAPTALWKLPANTGRKWAMVSGDWNPIHITGVSAKALGMPGVIAHGMYTASRALAESQVPAGSRWEYTISFGAPVVLPATVPVAITRAGRPGEPAMDIVAWDRKKKRPHFTAELRPL